MTPTSFDALGERGRARRFRPLALDALRAWDLDVRRVRLVTNGYNAVYRVDASQGAFALRVNLPLRTDAQLAAEVDWLDSLADAHVAVPRPVPTAKGDRWSVAGAPGVPEERRCVLFTWLAGRDLGVEGTGASFEAFGEVAAALHEQAARWRRPRGLVRVRSAFPYPDEPPILFEQRLRRSTRAVFERALVASERALVRVRAERPIVVHHDLHPGNVRVRSGGVSVLDFDDCVVATPSQDLGVAMFQMRMRGTAHERLAAFRRGYERVRSWPDDDIVSAFTAGAALTLANGVFQDFDPGYRRAASAYATRWARIADEALREA